MPEELVSVLPDLECSQDWHQNLEAAENRGKQYITPAVPQPESRERKWSKKFKRFKTSIQAINEGLLLNEASM